MKKVQAKSLNKAVADAFVYIAGALHYHGCWLRNSDLCRLICHESELPAGLNLNYTILNIALSRDARFKSAKDRNVSDETGGIFCKEYSSVPPLEDEK